MRKQLTTSSPFRAFECFGNDDAQPLHCHEEVEFAAVCRGHGTLQSRVSRQAAGPGVFSVVCPWEPHAGTPLTPDCTVQVLNVPAAWFAQSELSWAALWQRETVREGGPALPILSHLFESVRRGDSLLLQEEWLLALYRETADASPTSRGQARGREQKRIEAATEFLRAHIGENVSLAQLAAHVELSPAHLCRAFKKQTGLSPHAYQNSLRVARAKTLLDAGQAAADVALEVGFTDQSHLIHHFKRLLGITPGQSQKAIFSYPPGSNAG